jgi:hypothetical protein
MIPEPIGADAMTNSPPGHLPSILGARDPIRPPEQHRENLLRIARRRIENGARDRLEASDLVQQTLVAALERRDQFHRVRNDPPRLPQRQTRWSTATSKRSA